MFLIVLEKHSRDVISGGLALGLEEDRKILRWLLVTVCARRDKEEPTNASLPSHALKGSRSWRRSEVGETATLMDERSAGGAW